MIDGLRGRKDVSALERGDKDDYKRDDDCSADCEYGVEKPY